MNSNENINIDENSLDTSFFKCSWLAYIKPTFIFFVTLTIFAAVYIKYGKMNDFIIANDNY